MSADQQKLQSVSNAPEKISILLVTPYPEDENALHNILHHGAWSISRCDCASKAMAQVRVILPAIVICESDLADGSWKTVLAACESTPNPPLLLVTSKNADEVLWAEVLNLGGYDVLLKPFDRGEVTRVIGMAWRQWFGHVVKQPVAAASAPRMLSAHFA